MTRRTKKRICNMAGNGHLSKARLRLTINKGMAMCNEDKGSKFVINFNNGQRLVIEKDVNESKK